MGTVVDICNGLQSQRWNNLMHNSMVALGIESDTALFAFVEARWLPNISFQNASCTVPVLSCRLATMVGSSPQAFDHDGLGS